MPNGIPYASDDFSAQNAPAAQRKEAFTVTICLSVINIDREGLNGITKIFLSHFHQRSVLTGFVSKHDGL